MPAIPPPIWRFGRRPARSSSSRRAHGSPARRRGSARSKPSFPRPSIAKALRKVRPPAPVGEERPRLRPARARRPVRQSGRLDERGARLRRDRRAGLDHVPPQRPVRPARRPQALVEARTAAGERQAAGRRRSRGATGRLRGRLRPCRDGECGRRRRARGLSRRHRRLFDAA